MSTLDVTTTVVKKPSLLSTLGLEIKKDATKVDSILKRTLPAVEEGAKIAALFDPAMGALFVPIGQAAILVEGLFATGGKQNGTGAAKADSVASTLETIIVGILQQFGRPGTADEVKLRIDQVVSYLNQDTNFIPAFEKALQG